MNDLTLAVADVTDAIELTYNSFSLNGLFNNKIFQDKLLFPTLTPSFFPELNTYLRFVTVNFGLTGLVTYRTPREYIEGFTDPLISTLNETPIYMGGDNTTSAFLSQL
jgi:hypothetical protein